MRVEPNPTLGEFVTVRADGDLVTIEHGPAELRQQWQGTAEQATAEGLLVQIVDPDRNEVAEVLAGAAIAAMPGIVAAKNGDLPLVELGGHLLAVLEDHGWAVRS